MDGEACVFNPTGGQEVMAGCGKIDNNGKVVTGAPLACGTKITYGVGKQPKHTVIHLCRDCEKTSKEN